MTIELRQVSKRYTDQWILKNIDLTLNHNVIYGILGSNGSGKSTLVNMLSGHLSPTRGDIIYRSNSGEEIRRDDIYNYVCLWGPHTGLLQHLTIREMVDYHFSFKTRIPQSLDLFMNKMNLSVPVDRKIHSLSSGQAQRLALSLTIMSQGDILLLDEPGSFLDEDSILWMNGLIQEFSDNRLVVIASNETRDLVLATASIHVQDYH